MSGDPRRLTMEEERERLYTTRYRGGLCALCGRTLGEGEPVFWESFAVGRVGGITHHPRAPVASERASARLRREQEHEDPERCGGCGRPVYYATASTKRHRAVCSQRCQVRATRATRPARKGEA